ncbi:MAG: hypothetical protein ACK5QT_03130, partial [Oligoflexia bacterium]
VRGTALEALSSRELHRNEIVGERIQSLLRKPAGDLSALREALLTDVVKLSREKILKGAQPKPSTTPEQSQGRSSGVLDE